jgi:hypothetical protein
VETTVLVLRRRWREVVRVVDEDQFRFDSRQLQQPLDRGGAADDREVMPVAARELVLPQQLAQAAEVHERQSAKVQHDVPHPVGLGLQRLQHLSHLRGRDEVQLAAERDQGGPPMPARLRARLLGADT